MTFQELENKAARYEYLCACRDEVKLDLLAEVLGNRESLSELIDAFMAEEQGAPDA
jgi:hypothetical protein